jgi:hypothetical protein
LRSADLGCSVPILSVLGLARVAPREVGRR